MKSPAKPKVRGRQSDVAGVSTQVAPKKSPAKLAAPKARRAPRQGQVPGQGKSPKAAAASSMACDRPHRSTQAAAIWPQARGQAGEGAVEGVGHAQIAARRES